MNQKSTKCVWGARFAWMMMLNAVMFLVISALIVIPSALSASGISIMSPELTRVITYGSAGTWFVMGYIFYFLIGVISMGIFAIGYYILENNFNVRFNKAYRVAAWIHYILMSTGVILSTWILMYAGYYGVSRLMAKTPTEELHPVMAQFGIVIGISILIMIIGICCGLLLFTIQFRRNNIRIIQSLTQSG